jgi:hypothetical protein
LDKYQNEEFVCWNIWVLQQLLIIWYIKEAVQSAIKGEVKLQVDWVWVIIDTHFVREGKNIRYRIGEKIQAY